MLNDNLLAFWFSHVYGETRLPNKAELNIFVSRRFEPLCMDFMSRFIESKGERIIKYGKWWGNVEIEKGKFEQREIDLIIETEKTLYVGECKWSDNRIGESELGHLKQSARALKTKKPIKWVMFNKKGFSVDESTGVLLFDAERIVKTGF